MNTTGIKLRTTIPWVLAAAYAAALVANIAFGLSIPIGIVLLLSVAFALVHGAARYGWRGIAAFIVRAPKVLHKRTYQPLYAVSRWKPSQTDRSACPHPRIQGKGPG